MYYDSLRNIYSTSTSLLYYFSKTDGTLSLIRAILESRISLLLRPIPQQISANHMKVVSVKIRAQRTSGPSKCVRVRGSSSGRSEILTFTNGIWREDDQVLRHTGHHKRVISASYCRYEDLLAFRFSSLLSYNQPMLLSSFHAT